MKLHGRLHQKERQLRYMKMKPKKYSPAHSSEQFAELICSNSFKADRIEKCCAFAERGDASFSYSARCNVRINAVYLQAEHWQ